MFVAINRLRMPAEYGNHLEERFSQNAGGMAGVAGFVSFDLLRAEEGGEYLVVTRPSWAPTRSSSASRDPPAFRAPGGPWCLSRSPSSPWRRCVRSKLPRWRPARPNVSSRSGQASRWRTSLRMSFAMPGSSDRTRGSWCWWGPATTAATRWWPGAVSPPVAARYACGTARAAHSQMPSGTTCGRKALISRSSATISIRGRASRSSR